MNDIVPIESVPFASYDTFEGAIAGAKRHPKQAKAMRDGDLLAGHHFVNARCNLRQWVLEFSGSIWLRVFAESEDVDWQVTDELPVIDAVAEPIVFEWQNGEKSTVDCRELAAQRRWADFWQLWVNETGLFVYLRRKLILCFHTVKRRDTGEMLLFVCEDD